MQQEPKETDPKKTEAPDEVVIDDLNGDDKPVEKPNEQTES